MSGLIIDYFAGGGGASEGLEVAYGRKVDIAINHDREALAMHAANHPETLHVQEDVFQVDIAKLCAGRAIDVAWFSPDCTHHSRAKGGKPVSNKRRGLAWVVLKMASLPKWQRPRVIHLENVPEFAEWCPLKNGRPDRSRKGETFRLWCSHLQALGYRVEFRDLVAWEFGAPTTRKRLVLVARCDGEPIVWPEPTHFRPSSNGKRPPQVRMALKPWRTAADCIDWSIPCPSIFDRKRPLAEATNRRIALGISKFVVKNPQPFIVSVAHGYSGGRRDYSIDEPLGTVHASGQSRALVTPFIARVTQSSAAGVFDATQPVRTITTAKGGEMVLVAPTLVQTSYGEREGQAPRALDLHQPLGTVVAGGGKHALVAAFLAQFNNDRGTEPNAGRALGEPVSTVSTRGPHQALVAAHILSLKGSDRRHQEMNMPAPAICAGGTHVAAVAAFLIKYYGTDQDPRLDHPLHSVTTKDRFGLVTVDIAGETYAIVDIGMRMLSPRELFRAQGFQDSYIIDPEVAGKRLTKTAAIRMCGNSVCPPLATAVAVANAPMMSRMATLKAVRS